MLSHTHRPKIIIVFVSIFIRAITDHAFNAFLSFTEFITLKFTQDKQGFLLPKINLAQIPSFKLYEPFSCFMCHVVISNNRENAF